MEKKIKEKSWNKRRKR